jgi:hypothetical protein
MLISNIIKAATLSIALIAPVGLSPTQAIAIPHVTPVVTKPEIVKKKKIVPKSFDHFLLSLAHRESGNNWKVYNKYGFMGKYQIGKMALEDIGITNVHYDDFKECPEVTFPEELQDSAMLLLVKKNKMYVRRAIRMYSDSIVNGHKITESGIIAAAHLVGSGSTNKWFRDSGKVDIKDGNGVSITHYIELFAGYDIP